VKRQHTITALFGVVFANPSLCLAAESAKDIIAARVIGVGYPCIAPIAASHDLQHIVRNEASWMLYCKNATYRVGVIADISKPIHIYEVLTTSSFTERQNWPVENK
jgi:hypothetical protein